MNLQEEADYMLDVYQATIIKEAPPAPSAPQLPPEVEADTVSAEEVGKEQLQPAAVETTKAPVRRLEPKQPEQDEQELLSAAISVLAASAAVARAEAAAAERQRLPPAQGTAKHTGMQLLNAESSMDVAVSRRRDPGERLPIPSAEVVAHCDDEPARQHTTYRAGLYAVEGRTGAVAGRVTVSDAAYHTAEGMQHTMGLAMPGAAGGGALISHCLRGPMSEGGAAIMGSSRSSIGSHGGIIHASLAASLGDVNAQMKTGAAAGAAGYSPRCYTGGSEPGGGHSPAAAGRNLGAPSNDLGLDVPPIGSEVSPGHASCACTQEDSGRPAAWKAGRDSVVQGPRSAVAAGTALASGNSRHGNGALTSWTSREIEMRAPMLAVGEQRQLHEAAVQTEKQQEEQHQHHQEQQQHEEDPQPEQQLEEQWQPRQSVGQLVKATPTAAGVAESLHAYLTTHSKWVQKSSLELLLWYLERHAMQSAV